MGPNAPTTAAENPTMSKIPSFFQIDHYQEHKSVGMDF
jgi:hypothetical protein